MHLSTPSTFFSILARPALVLCLLVDKRDDALVVQRDDRLATATVGGRTDLGGAFGVLVVVVPVAVLAQIVRFI